MKRFASSLIIMGLMLVPVSANAHAGVVSTFPAQDQVFDVMPLDIQVKFSEELLTIEGQSVNTLTLATLDGTPIEISEPTVKGNEVTAMIPEIEYEAGTYEVTYTVVSADGHKVSDSFTFAVNAPVTTSAPYVAVKGDGVLPLPIVAAIAIITLLAGLFLFRARKP